MSRNIDFDTLFEIFKSSRDIGRTPFSYEHGAKTDHGDVVLSASRFTYQDCAAHAIASTMEAKYRLYWSKTMRKSFPYALSVQEIHDSSTNSGFRGDLPEYPRFKIKGFRRLPLEAKIIAERIKFDGPLICSMRMHESYGDLSWINKALGIYRGVGQRVWTDEDGSHVLESERQKDDSHVLKSDCQLGHKYEPLSHAVSLVGYFWSIDGELLFRFQDDGGPKEGNSGFRTVSIDAMEEVYEIWVGGYDSVVLR